MHTVDLIFYYYSNIIGTVIGFILLSKVKLVKHNSFPFEFLTQVILDKQIYCEKYFIYLYSQ